MNDSSQSHISSPQSRRYIWPWFVLVGFLLAVLLAILWVSKEVQRTRRQRDPNWNPPSSNVQNR
jgi:hypothetical protein